MDFASRTAIILPSYMPDGRLPEYVAALREARFGLIVVVDDGSGAEYDGIFASLPRDERTEVIRYGKNGGKGVALKTGMSYVEEHRPEFEYIVTADSDGQHTVKDVLRMSESLSEDDKGLLLGTRDFSEKTVPFKSRAGNRITSTVFMLLYGRWIADTQTGLRGFKRELLKTMLHVKGERYEYEMNVLIELSSMKLPIRPLPIDTVYENDNKGSHFRPLQDSARIYGVILSGFVRFISSSLLSFVIDYGLYLLFNYLLKSCAPTFEGEFRILFFHILTRIALATVLARVVSSVANFFINRKFVFSSELSKRRSFPRYVAVCVLIMLLSAGLTSSLHLLVGWGDNTAKLPVDIALFFLSYYLQRKWVFPKERK